LFFFSNFRGGLCGQLRYIPFECASRRSLKLGKVLVSRCIIKFFMWSFEIFQILITTKKMSGLFVQWWMRNCMNFFMVNLNFLRFFFLLMICFEIEHPNFDQWKNLSTFQRKPDLRSNVCATKASVFTFTVLVRIQLYPSPPDFCFFLGGGNYTIITLLGLQCKANSTS